MIRRRLASIFIAAALLAVLSGVALAQDDGPTGPEGVDWSLVSYYDVDLGESAMVPFEVQPTLRLEDGVASFGYGITVRMFGLDVNWDFAKRWDFENTLSSGYETSFWIGQRF